MVDDAGRDPSSIDIAFGSGAGGSPGDDGFDGDARVEGILELAGLGVTWSDVGVPGDSLDRAIEALERFGRDVIEPMRSA